MTLQPSTSCDSGPHTNPLQRNRTTFSLIRSENTQTGICTIKMSWMTSLRFLKIVSVTILESLKWDFSITDESLLIKNDCDISQCDVLSAALLFPKGLPQRVDPHIWFGTVFRADAHPHNADISHYQHIYHAPTFSLNIHRDHFFLHITQSRSAVCQIVFLAYFYVVTVVNLTRLTQNLKPHTKTFQCWVSCCAFTPPPCWGVKSLPSFPVHGNWRTLMHFHPV